MPTQIRLGTIGGGVMAEAILSRVIQQNLYPPETLLVSEPQPQRRLFWQQTYQVQVTEDNLTAAKAEEVLLLAIKPQVLPAIATELSGKSDSQTKPLVISILAGVTLNRLEAIFPHYPIIRAMPNAAATVGAGMTAMAVGSLITANHLSLATTLLGAIGEVVTVPESLMDGVTGLSGSGPAYVALMVEALADGGVAAGLPRPIAAQLALQTVWGTAQMLRESGWHPAELKDRVTSPGGTTIAGVAQLEKSGFRSAVIEAVKAAYRRSQELG